MIKNLRKRFVLTAMIAVALVVGIMMAVINVVNYAQVLSRADEMITILEGNDGFFPRQNAFPNDRPKDSFSEMSEEAPYVTRFFSVTINGDGKAVSVNTGSIAAVSTAQAADYALEVYQSGKTSGFSGVYRYGVSATGGNTLILFLDRSRELDVFYSFLRTSFAVAAFAIVGIFLLVVLLSKRALRPIAESYAKQKQFITDASHELKTPLAVINANTEVLDLTQGESEWTRSIRNQVGRLSSLTDSLVSLSRLDEENGSLLMTEFSISDAVAEGLEPFAELARQDGKTITLDIQRNLTYNGNEESIRKLMGILADNAIKYSAPNSDIFFSLRASGRGVVLRVKNPVEGIEKGAHDELFERFYRADSSRSDKLGYGIGLSIAKAICVSHKGRISATSEDGKSLTITANL